MSVTVRDVMKLPCMKGAEIVAGKSGIDNVVTSVTVMEYSSYSDEQDRIYDDANYEGSDIVISAFSSIANDQKKILAQIMNSHDVGEAGVIIYYFDLFIKELDQRIIDYADGAGFPIILMPRDQYQLRYSEAIAEITELIMEDRRQTENFVSSIMETFVSLPKNQQNITTLLRLLSNYVHLTMILLDRNWKIRAFAGWPKIPERETEEMINKIAEGCFDGLYEVITFDEVNGNTFSLVLTGREMPKKSTLEQISDVIRLYLKMSPDEFTESVGTSQLIRAIIGDEPLKMRKLAGNLGIDAAKLKCMLIYREPRLNINSGEVILREIKDCFSRYCHDYLVDIYAGDVVAFLDDSMASQWLPTLTMLSDSMRDKGLKPICVYARNLSDPSKVREAYLNVSANFDYAKKLYRDASIVSYHEIMFARDMKEIISGGEESIRKEMDVLRHMECFGRESYNEIADTLSSYYFDSHMSVTETAKNLFVHVNTIKYRLKKVSEMIGCRVTDMPEMMELYKALALRRLLE